MRVWKFNSPLHKNKRRAGTWVCPCPPGIIKIFFEKKPFEKFKGESLRSQIDDFWPARIVRFGISQPWHSYHIWTLPLFFENFSDFIFYFRATCLFSYFRIWSTEVICKTATELLKSQRRLTRQKTTMLKVLSLLWTENSTFLEEFLTSTRYSFVEQIKIRRLVKII